MVIGIDASSANKKEKTGVEWHAFHLIQHLKTRAVEGGDRVVLFSPTPLEGELAELPSGWESRVLKWSLPGGWMKGRMTWEMIRRPVDVLFVPGQGLPLKGGRKGMVTTIHDIGFHRLPNLYEPKTRRRLESVTRRAVKKARLLFVPSEFTKREVMDAYRVKPERMVVAPNASDETACASAAPGALEALLQKYRLSKHYFLCIGRLETKKNVTTLIRAFEQFKSWRGTGDPFELVLVGSPGYGFSTIKRFYDGSAVRDAIHYLGYLPEAETKILLKGATAYVFPSWYEGFGIPNVEAMLCGTPLITSDIPPHREVVGDAALFVPPAEIETWARAMRRLVEEAGLRESLVAAGTEQAKKYRWDETARITWEALRNLV